MALTSNNKGMLICFLIGMLVLETAVYVAGPVDFLIPFSPKVALISREIVTKTS